MKNRIVSALLLLCMLASTLASLGITVGAATVGEGMTFTAADQYKIPYLLNVQKPAQGDEAMTIEAEIWIDPATGDTARAGAVLGNYRAKSSSQARSMGLEIYTGGRVRLHTNHAGDTVFESVDLRQYVGTASAPKFVKISVVINATQQAMSLYVNGKHMETKTNTNLTSGELVLNDAFVLGGDLRSGNSQYFKGNIKNVAVYADARTASEITADASKTAFSVDSADANLLFAYDLTQRPPKCFEDLSANGYDIPNSYAYVEGMTFRADTTYEIQHKLNIQTPASGDEAMTVEMELHIDPTSSGRGGTVLGCYDENTLKNGLNIEMYSNGTLRLYTNHAGDTKFSTDLRPYMGTVSAPKHAKIALVINVTQKRAYLYVNGTQVENKKITSFEPGDLVLPDNFILGGDARANNANYFKGDLKNLAVWSDARTAAEITADAAKETFSVASDSALLFAYDLTKETQTEAFTDLSGNGRHVIWKPQEGKSFVLGSHDKITKPLPNPPKTVEATIYMPTTVTTRGGVIIGNLTDTSTDKRANFNFEINDKGQPRLYYARSTNLVFTDIDVRTYGGWVHLALVFDDSNPDMNTITCYVNGEAKQTLTHTGDYLSTMNHTTYCIGADFRTVNTPENARFKGYIKDVTLYTDVRNATEIKSDYQNGASLTDASVLAAWDFTKTIGFRDLTGNGYDIFNPDAGMTFTQEDLYRTNSDFSTRPYTFETWLQLPKSYSGRGGVIFGNVTQMGDQDNALSFEISSNGNPRLYFYTNGSKNRSFTFTNVDVRSDGWTHLAIVYDKTLKQIHCYLNGELVQTLTKHDKDTTTDASISVPSGYKNTSLGQMALGGDMRDQTAPTNLTKRNEQYFKGVLHDLALFDDVRTADEIKADFENGITNSASGLISYYNLEDADGYEKVNDKKNGNHFTTVWELNPREDVTDYDYTFAVLGDTQKLIEQDFLKGTTYFKSIYDWIVEHREEKNIQLVMGLGDITENGHDGGDTGVEGPGEWEIAKAVIPSTLGAAGIPYSLVPGNHENPEQLTTYFADEPSLTNNITGYYTNDAATLLGNYYMNIDVGEHKYTIFVLEYGAVDEILDWVGEVCDANPDRRVIITTHAYMFRDGTTLDKGDVVPPDSTGQKPLNNGDEMWEKLCSKHRNILMVLSGHDPCENIIYRQDAGEYGNIVTQMLIDPQGMDKTYGYRTGMVALFHFSNDGKDLYVEYVSTIRDEYFREENQFKLSLYSEDKGGVHSIVAGEAENTYRVYFANGTYEEFPVGNGMDGVATVNGYRLLLDDKIGVASYLALPKFFTPASVSLKFTVNGEETLLSLSDATENEYGFGFVGYVSAAQMTKTVTLELYYDEVLLLRSTFTVAEYAKKILENADTNPEYAAAVDLVKAMLNYGAQSQLYFDEDVDSLANAILSEAERVIADRTEEILLLANASTEGELYGVSYLTTALGLQSETVIYHYFNLTDDALYTVQCEGAEVEYEVVGGRLVVKLHGIDAANLATVYRLTLENGEETLTVSCNAFAYAKAVVSSETAGDHLKLLMYALYEYYAATAAYSA